jgi:hypothetical protein
LFAVLLFEYTCPFPHPTWRVTLDPLELSGIELRLRKVAIATARTIEISFASLVLAWVGLKIAEMRDCWTCTPGLALAERFVVPKDSAHGLDVFFRQISLAIATDTLIWFAFIGSIALAISRSRRRRAAAQTLKGLE